MDKLRSWYDDFDIGASSKVAPFESLICSSSILYSAEKERNITSQKDNFTARMKRKYGELDAKLDVTSNSLIPIPEVLVNGLKFVNSLALYSKECVSAEITQLKLASVISEKPHLESSAATLNDRKVSPNGPVGLENGQVDNTADKSNSLMNRFKSAKQEFVKDGGNLNTIEKKTYSNPSKSSSSGPNSGGQTKSDKNEMAQYDSALMERIEGDILGSNKSKIAFNDIAGLHFAKKCVQEVVCWPMLRPDLFVGLRALPKGVLLFGPPGTGKTLIGKAIAHEVGATFFSISASSLTSKWIGEGERLVRALFTIAVERQPSIIFIDEVDSLLSNRSSEENEASRRMKTEFLVQLDGAGTDSSAQVVIIGATNRPDELDEAARRRFVKRIYIPLPDAEGRKQLICSLLCNDKSGTVRHALSEHDVNKLVEMTSGYSGADIRNVCTEAAMGPVREVTAAAAGGAMALKNVNAESFPPISHRHVVTALESVTSSVSQSDLKRYIDWNSQFGTYKRMEGV